MSYKILSLDGGGSWALIQARVLQDIYGDIRGHELLQKFDMAISNSGGSLVLASLCNDMKLSEIINIFLTQSSLRQVFSPLTLEEKIFDDSIALLRGITGIGPRYRTVRKLEGLQKILRDNDHLFNDKKIILKPIVDTPLNELPSIIGKEAFQIVIVGFDYFRKRVSFFRSNENSNTDKFSNKFYSMQLGHAIHASSNAPVNYFDLPATTTPQIFPGEYQTTLWFWDGAVSGFNNPVLAGLTEAVTNGISIKDCCILSIGTSTSSKAVLTDSKFSSDPKAQKIFKDNENNDLAFTDTTFHALHDIKEMATSILQDPPDSATFIVYSMMDPSLNNTANIVRINPCIAPILKNDEYDIPEVYARDEDGRRKFLELIEMDMDAVEIEEVKLISELCDRFIVNDDKAALPNQLIRGDATNNKPVLGYGTYKAAKEKWLECIGLI